MRQGAGEGWAEEKVEGVTDRGGGELAAIPADGTAELAEEGWRRARQLDAQAGEHTQPEDDCDRACGVCMTPVVRLCHACPPNRGKPCTIASSAEARPCRVIPREN